MPNWLLNFSNWYGSGGKKLLYRYILATWKIWNNNIVNNGWGPHGCSLLMDHPLKNRAEPGSRGNSQWRATTELGLQVGEQLQAVGAEAYHQSLCQRAGYPGSHSGTARLAILSSCSLSLLEWVGCDLTEWGKSPTVEWGLLQLEGRQEGAPETLFPPWTWASPGHGSSSCTLSTLCQVSDSLRDHLILLLPDLNWQKCRWLGNATHL